ncbi:MAG: 30S ribosomal protein S13 [Bdellovibrionia bacterium]
MARISGVDLPKNKRVEVALQYLYGIGRHRAQLICRELNFDPAMRTDNMTDVDIAKIRDLFEKNGYAVEGDLRRDVGLSIKRLMDLGCYRGIRHRKNLPTRGQRTKSNSRTRKGPRKTVANKKKAV